MNIPKILRKIEKKLGLPRKKYNGLDITVDLEVADCEGYTYSHGSYIRVVISKLDPLVLAHELVHVVQFRHKLPVCEEQAYGLEQKVLKWLLQVCGGEMKAADYLEDVASMYIDMWIKEITEAEYNELVRG